MARNDLIITDGTWGLLPPAEQAQWDNHYINFAAQAGVLSGTLTGVLYTLLYETITQNVSAEYNINTGGYNHIFNGNSKTVNGTEDYLFDLRGFSGSSGNEGSLTFTSFIINGGGVTKDRLITWDIKSVCTFNLINTIIYNAGDRALYMYSALPNSGIVNVRQLTIFDCAGTGVYKGERISLMQNCYISANTIALNTCPAVCEGVVTNDTTAPEVVNQNKAAIDMFESITPGEEGFLIPKYGTVMETSSVDSSVTPSLNGYPRPPWYVGANNPVPDGPTLTTPLDTATEVSTSPTFTWEEVVDTTSYRIQVSIDSDFSTTVIDVPGILVENYTVVTPLDVEQLYYWRVLSVFGTSESDWSTVFSFTTTSSSGGGGTIARYKERPSKAFSFSM